MGKETMDTLGGLGYTRQTGPMEEQRSEDRLLLSRQPEGRLSVLTPLARVAAHRVRDVSVSGISLELERPIAPETPVSIEYVGEDISLSVVGRIAWSRDNDPGPEATTGYVAGIELYSPGLLLNMLPTVRH